MMFGYRVVMLSDANATHKRLGARDAEHAVTLDNFRRFFAGVMTTDQAIGRLEPAKRPAQAEPAPTLARPAHR